MRIKFFAKLAAFGLVASLLCSGCGTGVTVMAMVSPTISQVSPQVVTAGTPNVTVTVQGSNFQSQAALMVNGTAVPTTYVNSTTLAAKISGSPLAQPAVAQLQVRNHDGSSSNQVPFTVTNAPQNGASLSITTTDLASVQVGTQYTATFNANGGAQPYSWTLSSGAVPTGLTLTSAGVLSGTPTTTGTFSFAITCTDASSPQLTKTITFSIVVTPAATVPTALSISSSALASAKVGTAYSASLSATGGTQSYTWSIASGSLPAGLSLSSAGVISGTPTATGTSAFTVAVKDSGSPAQTTSAQESITVSASGLSITTTSLAAGKDGSSYSASLSASGGTPSYTWSIASGSLPAGLSLSSAGVISGTPTATGTSTFTVAVKDSGSQTASAQESITVSASGLSITSATLPTGKNGSSYSGSFGASGGTPGYTWSIASGSLPAGLNLSSGGVISGTPTATGSSTFTVSVKDSGSPAQTTSAQETITVSASGLSVTTTSLAAGKDGSSYSASLSASGGTPSYTWSLASGSLPAGLSLSSNGVISGTPSATGTSNFTVAVTDSGSQTATAQETITVSAAALSITTTSLAAGTDGTSYSAYLNASGGTPSFTWSIASGSLPAGLSLSSAGVISGTPTATGTSTFTVAVKDGGSPVQTASAQESITVSPAALTITTVSLSSVKTGTSYTATLGATGGTGNYTWSLASGSLPAGLSLSSGGVISGTPTTTGSSTFTVSVKDSGSPAQTATQQELIDVTATALTITTTNLAAATNGSSYSASLSASGGTPSYTWSIASGSLPAGLSLSSAGVISGTPTATGTSTFTVSVKDSGSQTASAQEAITVSATALSITTTSLAAGKDGSSYSASLSASGGTPSYTWSIASGSLPAGLSLSSGGAISGTPTATGTSTFTVAVKDNGSPVQTVSAQESITVSAAALSITSTSLAAGKDGGFYNTSLSATGGTPSYTWSISSGSLPAGLSMSSGGVISGTPTAAGTSTFTVAVKDSGSPVQTASAQVSITVAAASLTVNSTSFASATEGTSYSASVSATGGTPNYTWSISSGSLPAGLSLSSAGAISGTPTATGTSTFTVSVKDSGSPAQTATAQESITVAPPALAVTSANLAGGKDGTSYSVSLSATGGTPNYTWSISSGSLPAGLNLSSAGVISGTPTATGTSTFTVAVKDSGSPAQTATAQESITVAAAASTLTITSTSLGGAQTGSSYSTTLNATGGTPSYTWAVTSGSLPTGLSMSSAGVISGTPTATGTANFTVTVTDSASPAQTASAQESIAVTVSDLAITTVSLGAGSTGTGYSVALAASGGTPSYTWSVSAGSLPAGLSLSSAGVISGTPTAAGSATFTVSVSDGETPAQTATSQFAITVNGSSGSGSNSGAAQLYLYPTAPIAPQGSYQTVTAVVTGVNDKTVTWTSDGGTIVGANPCVVNEPCTVALYAKSTGTYHLTATSNANNSVVATSTITITAAPTPVTGHPRLLITAAMLPALRAKATSSNVMYQAMRTIAIGSFNNDNANFSWSCNGGSGTPSSQQDAGQEMTRALQYAELALVDPDDPTYNWGCYGHDTAVYAMGQLSSGAQTVTGNSWSDTVDSYVLAPDYLMGAGALTSSSDLTLTRNYAAFMLKSTMTTQTTYGTYGPYNNWNSPQQFANGVGQLRIFGNNYTMTRMEYLVGLSLLFDDNTTDDPPLANTCSATRYQVCPDFTAGSLHAYAAYFEGSMMLNMYAHDEDPGVVNDAYAAAYSGFSGYSHSSPFQCSVYSANTNCFGDGRDGESAEGSWYQYSIYRLRYAMNMLHTTGYDNPGAACLGSSVGTTCPQLSLATSSWWDMKLVSDLFFLDGWNTPKTQQPSFGFFNTGDANETQRWPDDFQAEVESLTDDSLRGRTDRSNSILWAAFNTALGGPTGSLGGCQPFYYCGFDSSLTMYAGLNLSWDMFISQPAGDPVGGTLPTDPRPSLPSDLFQGGYTQHLEVHSGTGTGWGGYESTFGYYCMNSITDHEHSPCGRYDIVSSIGGEDEYIVHGRSNFADYSYLGSTAPNSDIPQIDNATASSCSTGTVFANIQTYGSQWWYGQQEAMPILISHSELPSYVATDVDDTGMYNTNNSSACPGANDVTGASRTLIYLRGSRQVITYDRTATGAARDKVNSIIASGNATVNGNVASWLTPSGNQKAYWTSLLPAGKSPVDLQLTSSNDAYVTGGSSCSGQGYCEPFVNARVSVDAGSVTSANFLSVLEWGGSTLAQSSTSLVQSSAGQNYDGALVGSSLAMFMQSRGSFTGTTFPASGAATVYVANLTPNTTYAITGTGSPATAATDSAGVLTFASGGTGNITIANAQ